MGCSTPTSTEGGVGVYKEPTSTEGGGVLMHLSRSHFHRGEGLNFPMEFGHSENDSLIMKPLTPRGVIMHLIGVSDSNN